MKSAAARPLETGKRIESRNRLSVRIRPKFGLDASQWTQAWTGSIDDEELDPAFCWQAVYSRDKRFDGRFFGGITTTGVYCRPSCPMSFGSPEYVRWFRSAEAAEAAGFRACLRCRPTTLSDGRVWAGTSTVVARALKLIAEGALAEGSMEELAARVGIGSRHLRRLFIEHLGVPPLKVARMHRANVAVQLIENTDLPMTEIALSTGFGSIRQFNHDILGTFQHPPTRLRNRRSAQINEQTGGLTIQLPYIPPFDWDSLVGFLKPRISPHVEFIDNTVYRRALQLGSASGAIEIWPDSAHSRLMMRVALESYDSLMQVVERARHVFDLGANPNQIRKRLCGDLTFAPLLRKRPGLRVPGAWNPFEIAVHAALGQTATTEGNVEIVERFIHTLGSTASVVMPGVSHLFPTPSVVLSSDLKAIGIPEPQTILLKAIARLFSSELSASFRSSEALIAKLKTLPGFSLDAVAYVSMRAFSDPDAFPKNDPQLARALNMGRVARSTAETAQLIEALRPWRSYAAIHLEAELREERFEHKPNCTLPGNTFDTQSTFGCPRTADSRFL